MSDIPARTADAERPVPRRVFPRLGPRLEHVVCLLAILTLATDQSPRRPLLSHQERRLLLAYTSGLTLATAAHRIGIRPMTAKTYLQRIKNKYLRVGRPAYTKLDLAARADEDGLLRRSGTAGQGPPRAIEDVGSPSVW